MSDEINNDEEINNEIQEASYTIEDEDNNDSDDEQEVETGRLLTGQNYELPELADKFIDTSKGELIDKSKLSDFDVIKAVAKQKGVAIRNPRSGCKKCYGRGYIGWDNKTKAPIPCNCIYPAKTEDQKMQEHNIDKKNAPVNFNRKTYKQLRKLIKAEKKMVNKQKREEENRLKQIES